MLQAAVPCLVWELALRIIPNGRGRGRVGRLRIGLEKTGLGPHCSSLQSITGIFHFSLTSPIGRLELKSTEKNKFSPFFKIAFNGEDISYHPNQLLLATLGLWPHQWSILQRVVQSSM